MKDWKITVDSLPLPAFVIGSKAKIIFSNSIFAEKMDCPAGMKVGIVGDLQNKGIASTETISFGKMTQDVFLVEKNEDEVLFVLGDWKTKNNNSAPWFKEKKDIFLILSDEYGNISYHTDGLTDSLIGMRRAIDNVENLHLFFASDDFDLQKYKKLLLDGEKFETKVTKGPSAGCNATFDVAQQKSPRSGNNAKFIIFWIDKENRRPKKFEEMLKIHEAFDEISSFAFMVVTGDNDNVFFANNQARELFGLTKNPSDELFVPNYCVLPPQLKDALKDELKNTKDIASGQIEYKTKLGKIRHFRVVSKALELFGKPSKILVLHDVTKLSQMERRLARYENLEKLIETLGSEISGKDSLDKYLEVTLELICKHFGLASGVIYFEELGDFVQKKIYGEKIGPMSEIHKFAIRKVFESGKPQVVGSAFATNDDVYYLLPIFGSDGLTGVFSFRSQTLDENIINQFDTIMPVVASGIELCRMKTRESQYIEELERLSSFRSDILESVNHEMKTPLTSILGYAELILSGTIKGSEQTINAANSIYAAGKQLETLIGELSKLSYNTIVVPEMAVQEVNTREVLKTASNLMLPIFEAAVLSFRANIPEDLPWVKADPTKLKEILLNMLSNAAKYTESGGEITLSASVIGGNFIRMEVKDTGIGISSEKKRFIFKKYYRQANEKTGKGLGLYLSKIYAEAMGGKIYFESEGRGKGAAFYLLLPSINSNPK